jgi:hypothetical protein
MCRVDIWIPRRPLASGAPTRVPSLSPLGATGCTPGVLLLAGATPASRDEQFRCLFAIQMPGQ